MNALKRTAIKAEEAELLTIDQARVRYQLGRNKIDELAADCGAILKIGKTKRYRKRILDEYIYSFEA